MPKLGGTKITITLIDSVSHRFHHGTAATGGHGSSTSPLGAEGWISHTFDSWCRLFCPDHSWNCQRNTYTWPLHVTWASSQHGDWVLRVSTVRQHGGSHITTCDPASEVIMQHHVCYIRFYRRKSLREENWFPRFGGSDNQITQERVEPEMWLWPYSWNNPLGQELSLWV